ncbi:mucoidy inhibitor MuiA family protein [Chitinophaga sp. SYP-B3965]|uniref:DUF4139 domain-containing protein n=1 Tax=Chitinophaga sp. SYP-B3965 TaxID=2663120 RepID=UPI001299836F|nr:DUF4139 domain-containing protein [Chitinophaga sp. SYP-B3965]MRG47225.1 mucoidy inhibitor MuiA family protein [Chitinophaga sp. SYP-B3965]
MKIHLCVVLSFIGANLHAQTKKQTVNATIDKVTVFMQGAQVTRSATTNIPAGTTTLVFPNISPELEEKSIQVQGKGAFTILSVSRNRNYMGVQAPIEEVTRLQQQQSLLEEKRLREKNRLKVFAQEEAMLGKNQDLRGTNTGLKTQDLRDALDFQRTRLTEILEQQLAIEKNINTLTDQIHRLVSQQVSLMAVKDSSTSDLLITVMAKENINGKLSLSYLVKNAGWYPTYELRVENISQPLEMAYKANVFQQCGEEWKNVKLSLSNGNPSESGSKPELQPWQMRTFYSMQELVNSRSGQKTTGKNEARGRVLDPEGKPINGATIRVPNRSIGTITNENGEFSLQMPQDVSTLELNFLGYEPEEIRPTGNFQSFVMRPSKSTLNEVVITGYATQYKKDLTGAVSSIRIRGTNSTVAPAPKVQETIPLSVNATFHTTSVNFDIATSYTILSDGKPYTVSIKEMEVPTHYEYHTAPKLDPAAYLLAGITDWEGLNLLEGEASIYFEGTYLGKSLLNLQTATDTLFVSLGKDKNIVINRKLQKDYSKNQFFGSNQTVTRNYEISVKNNKQEPIRILVEDQLPISIQREIEISKVEYPGARLDETTQQITWDLNIASKEEKKTKLQYAVKFPKDRIVNLD